MSSLSSAVALREARRQGEPLMRGHVLVRPGTLELREMPRPRAEAGEIVVRVRAALTCGTDLKTFLRGHPMFPLPMLFGHEFAGEVAEVGEGVGNFRAGDAVMAAPTAPCGACFYCRRGQENLCPQVMETMVHGAFAEYLRLPASIVRTNAFLKPAHLSFSEAALMEPLACVLHGLAQATLRGDDTVVLVGGGAITLLHLLALRARGVERILVVARNKARAAEARRFAASEVLVEDARAVRASILERTEGRGADVVIECTGQVDVWEASLGLARRGGQVVLFGGCAAGTAVRIDTRRLHYDQVRVVSPFHFTPRDVAHAHGLLSEGVLATAALVCAEHPLEELDLVLERLRRGEGPKFAILPGRE